MATNEARDWGDFVALICEQDITDSRKIVQLSQAMLESGRGTSELFTNYANPYGMKYRDALSSIALPINYKGDKYTYFHSLQDAVKGYWIFLNRPVYKGWEKFENDKHGLIRHIVRCGYVGDNIKKQAEYLYNVFRLTPEASHIIRVVTEIIN